MATAPQLLAWPCQPLPQLGTHRCPAPQQPSFCPSTSFRLAKRTQRWLRLMAPRPQALGEGDAGPPAKGCLLVPKQPWRPLSWGRARGNLPRAPQTRPSPTPRGAAGCSQGQRKELGSELASHQGCPAPPRAVGAEGKRKQPHARATRSGRPLRPAGPGTAEAERGGRRGSSGQGQAPW